MKIRTFQPGFNAESVVRGATESDNALWGAPAMAVESVPVSVPVFTARWEQLYSTGWLSGCVQTGFALIDSGAGRVVEMGLAESGDAWQLSHVRRATGTAEVLAALDQFGVADEELEVRMVSIASLGLEAFWIPSESMVVPARPGMVKVERGRAYSSVEFEAQVTAWVTAHPAVNVDPDHWTPLEALNLPPI